MKVEIPIEWYQILERLARDRKAKFSQVVSVALKEEECLGLPEVKESGRKRAVNLDLDVDEGKAVELIRKYLFCK